MKKPKLEQRIGYFPTEEGREGRRWDVPTEKPVDTTKRHFSKGRLLLLAICLIVLIGSGYALLRYGLDYVRAQQTSQELRELHEQTKEETAQTPPATLETPETAKPEEPQSTAAPIVTPDAGTVDSEKAQKADSGDGRTRDTSYPDNPTLTASQAILTLQKRNKDIVGWLTIDDVVDEAVVQRDNAYYLKRDYLGYHNTTGALFLDESCKLAEVPEKLVIHGHNMKTGAMFGALMKYKTKGVNFFKQHAILHLETLYEQTDYIAFAVLECDITPSSVNYLDFMSYPIFGSDGQFTAFVDRLKTLSMYSCGLEVAPGDRLLLLATCAGDQSDSRLIVAARRVREHEDALTLKTQLYSAQVQ